MTIASFILTILIQIGAPIALGWWLHRRYKVGWGIFGVGVLTFLGSQVVHLPLLGALNRLPASARFLLDPVIYPLNYALVLGLLAGICEETARWVGFRLLKERGRRWGSALMLGAGHGGVESILVGVTVLINLVVFALVRSGGTVGFLPAETIAEVQAQMDAFFGLPFLTPLAGAVERIFALVLQVTLTVMVWLSLAPRPGGQKPRFGGLWFVGAVLFHTLIDALAVWLSLAGWSAWAVEGVLAGLALISVVFLVQVRRRVRGWEQAEPLPVPEAAAEPELPSLQP